MRKRRELLLLLIIILVSIFIKSLNFESHLNFSYDQAWGSTKILEIWRNKEITLVGPGSSIIAEGKELLQGSIIYYFNMVFLLAGNFDPVKSSYAFMIFGCLMIVPLYYGVRNLIDKNTAYLISILYAFLPLYIDHTRFFFGPNFQLTLIPILIFLMGQYRKTLRPVFIFLIFTFSGILLQFHYQFAIVILGLLVYYFLQSKSKFYFLLLSILGLIVGFLPMIVFEIKNQFYNLRILALYVNSPKGENFQLTPHRILSISLLAFILLGAFIRKRWNMSLNFFILILLIIIDIKIYMPHPSHAYGMSPNWNFPLERKVYEIVQKQNLKDFNIVNHIYDNLSVVTKYQMRRDNYTINFDDYYHNNYLYVVSSTADIFSDPAYEINTFIPHKLVKTWKLNNYYNLYLFERIKK